MKERIENSVKTLREFYNSGATRPVKFRLEQLKRFKSAILTNQKLIEEALWSDLHKSPEEAYLTEISIVVQEIDNHIKHLKRWARPRRVASPIQILPSSSHIIYEPLGTALIIAPWNYPFQLTLNPLVGAISAGCVAMVKPAPSSKATSAIIEKILREAFDPTYIDIVQGNRDVNSMLLNERYDIIFFTGSPSLAKIVARSAAEHLTPTVMELGGKSPCIVDKDANIKMAARRIAWGKLLNAGQTCIAPDYLMVHSSVKEQLIEEMQRQIKSMFGDTRTSRFYPRIISDSAFERLTGLLSEGTIRFGGTTDATERYIEPTLIDGIKGDEKIMQEEIFGPILPVMEFSDINSAYEFIAEREKPLALYYFGKSGRKALERTTAGGSCINDTILHISNHRLPFGGVGNSGMGHYHGHFSFEAFSNARGVVKSATWIDMPFKYAPFKFFDIIRRII